MSLLSANKFKPCHWDSVEKALIPALGDYHQEAKRQVRLGNEFTFICEGAALLIRPEQDELVIVGFSGRHSLALVAPHVLSVAKRIGAKTLRCHTKRRGECRYLNRLGYPFKQAFVNGEYVLRMVINGR
ncbi:hypothetical protein [Vibrio viridaestus]|uniref:Uncharacterized protein n=1 Tax=Vibrio viridaestus TaxID=2487322 RepID=A0A3N9TAB1_9VIBR|nr:hypothetical protein [Vibrio viridaestus]RQW61031.1 hypothetical protein EES38_21520 [Vibrio viridaestus]